MPRSTPSATPSKLKTALDRGCLAILLLVSVGTGAWAYSTPAAWHRYFPGFGLSWLPQLGPYNEHLARDTGAAFLTLAVLSALALWRITDVVLTRATGASWLVFNGLHLGYHATMLHMYGLRDQLLSMGSLALLVVVSIVLLLPAPARSTPPPERKSAVDSPA
ncbi:hypothetical protein OOZ19_03720 [Saccharopolyspora sp. NFXS83]|uniref:hypothetical protein n=1 Tax=Saccharopolyspora sp. NFXS83 TaxID=2993560 RepID=UPI00224B0935|nr:hypothetical protein [Saccharopolyspora sp. NFXS83]MCX2729337.1 hypothetical protein [Saccharopolyspora sp. NFXS83]